MYDELVKRLRAQAVYLPEKFSKNAELLDVLMKAADAIEELQKRVPPVVRGKWIQKKNWTRGVCSACSWEIAFVTGNSYNFCPNCGADMKEEI